MTQLEKLLRYPLILFNPKVLKFEGKSSFEEGCLSVPGYTELVYRPEKVLVQALNEKGAALEFEADGLLSTAIQHEIDHLDGRLFLDRLSLIRKNLLKAQIKKHGYPERSAHRSVL